MWLRVALVFLLALPWIAPIGAASLPTGLIAGDAARLDSVVITAGPGGTSAVEAGRPAIDLAQGSADGLAPGTLFTIGDRAAPADDHAFALDNRGDGPAQVSLSYAYRRDPPATAGLTFAVYDASGTALAYGEDAVALTLEPGSVAYVVVTVSTYGTTPADDLSGSLEFAVTRWD